MHVSASIQQSKWFGPGLVFQIAFALLAALAGSAPAAAQFTVCNHNATTEIRVAISAAIIVNSVGPATNSITYDMATKTSGSTAVAAGQCQVILGGSLHDVASLYLFAWEPSNQAHTWGGDPQAATQHCLPTTAVKTVNFLYYDHEVNNPPCAAGWVKEPFVMVQFEGYLSFTEDFKDPLEGVAAPAANKPTASAASGKVAPSGGAASTPAPAPAPATTTVPKPAAAAAPKPAPAVQSTAAAPTGNAVLTVTSGMPAQAGGANPLAGHTVVLLNQNFEAVLTGAGLQAPQGVSLIKGYLAACAGNQPSCQAGITATNASTVSGARTDATGKAQLPGVPPGTYYFFCLGVYNNQQFKWDFPVQLKSGANSLTLDQHNAAAVN